MRNGRKKENNQAAIEVLYGKLDQVEPGVNKVAPLANLFLTGVLINYLKLPLVTYNLPQIYL